ncbi:dihydrolipoamide acetyltransferase family protein [Ignavigranum ruoffiae]|uniref:dihydrolipoamide acetyltransferase family protein n=1 Tax=Ignavigranum ruoffiae TaxID=89093 RepID=UPI0023567B91|nr:dihydrolipoamide acetyltransferase family protein [Ignavigranum ruoffiae]
MASNIVMPTLGLTMTEGTIEYLAVSVGDKVAKGDIVAEISSEKLTGPVEANADGIVLKILVSEGDVVRIKEPLMVIGQEGETVAEEEMESPAPEETEHTQEDRSTEPVGAEETKKQQEENKQERIFATPLARKMAKEKCIDLAKVNGTGGNGRITRLDIDRYVPMTDEVQETQSSTSKVADLPEWGQGLQGMRKTIAQRMMRSVQTTAQVTNQRKADVTKLMEFRHDIKTKVSSPLNHGEISINTLVTKAVILSLQEHPSLNAWYHNGEHTVMDEIHIGMATDLEEGLVVPVIRNADRMPLSKLGPAIAEVASQARNGELAGDLYSGSTFTITNLGGTNIEYFTPIINLPEVAILGVGAIQDELVLDHGEVKVAKKLPLSLTYDHQIIDGAPAARFLETLVGYLQDPYRLII